MYRRKFEPPKVKRQFRVLIKISACDDYPEGHTFIGTREHYSEHEMERAVWEGVKGWKYEQLIKSVLIARWPRRVN